MTAKKKQTKQTATKKTAKAPRTPAAAPGARTAPKASRGAARTQDAAKQSAITSEAHAKATAALLADIEKDAPKKEAAATSKPGRQAKAGAARSPKAAKPKRTSLLDAAAAILREAKEPLGARAIVEQVAARGLWKPTKGGKTPHATLYSAMTREIAKKGEASRFAKVDRGAFVAGKGA